MSETLKGFRRAARLSNSAISCSFAVLLFCAANAVAQAPQPTIPGSSISQEIMLRIMEAEDEKRWDSNLSILLSEPNAAVRQRVALAAGRICDEGAVPILANLLAKDQNAHVRQIAAFAFGEIEAATGANALIAILSNTQQSGPVRARA